MANNNAIILLLLGVALLVIGGKNIGLFSTLGITDGYIPFAKSTVSLSPPTCTTFTPGQFGRFEECDNGVWKWGKAYYFQSPGNPSGGEFQCYEAVVPDWNGAPSTDAGVFVDARKIGTVCADYDFSAANGKLYPSRNLKGLNYRAEFKVDAGSRYGGGARILLVDKPFFPTQSREIYNIGPGPGDNHVYDEGGIDLNPGLVQPNKISVKVKGIDVGQVDITGWEGLYVQYEVNPGAAWIPVKNSRYQPLLSCTKEPDELLAMESFSGGQELSIFSTRYAVQKYCLAHPVIVTSAAGSGTTAEPYQIWTQGGTTSIPTDQTWTVFYIIKNDGSLPTTCGEDAYDVKLGKCTKVSGFVQICSQGQFNPELGVCVVQPESITICPEGGRYDTTQGVCVYNPPVQYVCDLGTYESTLGKCIFRPPSQPNCPTGTEYDPIGNVCAFTPPTANVCPTGYTYNSATGRCEITPSSTVICPSGSTYNPTTGYCEQFPLRQIICDPYYAYDSTLDKCVRSPPQQILCPADYTYDAGMQKCVRYVPTKSICDSEGGFYDETLGWCTRKVPTLIECEGLGGTYDSTKNICVSTVETKTLCTIDDATYDATRNVCTKTVPTQSVCTIGVLSQDGLSCVYVPDSRASCPENSIYEPGNDVCLYTPPVVNQCVSGFTYDSARKVCTTTAKPTCLQGGNYDERFKNCVVLSNTAGLCPGGQLIVESGVSKCVSSPGSVCPINYKLENGRCLQQVTKERIPSFVTNPLFLASIALIVASIYLFSKKRR